MSSWARKLRSDADHTDVDSKYFFLPGKGGSLFATLTRPADRNNCTKAILYIHPFGEEMNKSRRTVALQARALGEMGYAVLTVDLPGCGDSYGDLGAVSWNQWIDELEGCLSWLKRQTDSPVCLWGLRMGALLAAEIAANHKEDVERLILWQPVVEGRSIVSGFLRMSLAAALLRTNSQQETVAELRSQLASGSSVEIAGYQLSGSLSNSIEMQSLANYGYANHAVDWIEVSKLEKEKTAITSSRVIDIWNERGAKVRSHIAVGDSFWNTVEISECTGLIELTSHILESSAR